MTLAGVNSNIKYYQALQEKYEELYREALRKETLILEENIKKTLPYLTLDSQTVWKKQEGWVYREVKDPVLHAHPFKQVEEFLVAFDQTVDKDNDTQRVLYAKLISEEFAEFLQAYFGKNNVEQLDAVCDLIWVLVGYAKSRGWDVEGAFDEVARSNMSKLDPATRKSIKREDGKVMKGADYFYPELEKFLK